MSSNQIRVADYLMRHIASLGVDCVFLLPGGGAMHLDDAIACEPRLLAIPCHHEQACGIAAEAYGRTHSCGFGVAVVTTGPGATNMVTPVAGAWIESLPMLVISGQVKRVDALNGRSIRQGGVQEVDIISVIKPITKHAVTLNRPEDARKCIEEALFLMKSGRPGPVWIDVPLDIQAAAIDPDKLEGFVPSESTSLSSLNESLAEVNRLIESSTRPMFLIGHGVRISGATDTFKRIANSLGIPCAFTWNAADTLDWEHELYIGRPGVVAARAPNFAIQNCDCLISIGCRIDNIVTAYNPENFARSAQKVVVDVDPNELGRHTMPIKVKVCADALEFLTAWENDLPMMGSISAWRIKCADWKTRYPPLDGRSFDQRSPIGHFQLVDRLSDAIGKDRLVITGSSGLAVEVFYTAFRNKVGQRLFLTSGLGAMGYGLPASIGACLGSGKRQTVCIESDGSLMLNLQELATLKQLNLPITLVIMNNNGYASIRNTQRNYFNERYIGSGKSSGLWIPDFIQLATAMGIPCLRVTDIEQINAALFDDSLKVVEVILKEDETLSPKVSAMPQSDGSIISMPLEDMSPLLPRAVLRQEMLVPLHPLSEKIDG